MHGAVTELVEKRTLKKDNVTRGDNFKGKGLVCVDMGCLKFHNIG